MGEFFVSQSPAKGALKIDDFYNGEAAYGSGGGTLGFTARMFWLERTDLVLVLLTNVGCLHSGLKPTPVGMFYEQVLLQAALRFLPPRPL